MNTKEILNYIDNMELYQKDYDTILRLLNIGDPSLFTKILEEVIEGNLLWSDFDEILSNTNYSSILENNLRTQDEIYTMIDRLSEFRSEFSLPEITNENSELFIFPDLNNEFYTNETEKIRKELFYELFIPRKEDSILATACKVRFYNAYKNGELLFKNLINDKNYAYTDNVIIDNKGNMFEYINPDDILLFARSHIISLNYKDEILTEFDKQFMSSNNLTSDEIKKIKVLERLLRYNNFRNESGVEDE